MSLTVCVGARRAACTVTGELCTLFTLMELTSNRQLTVQLYSYMHTQHVSVCTLAGYYPLLQLSPHVSELPAAACVLSPNVVLLTLPN